MSIGNPSGARALNPAQTKYFSGQAQDGQEIRGDKQSNIGIDQLQEALTSDNSKIQGNVATTQTARQELRADADLQAQQDMAFYALLMFIATAATVILTGLGLYFIKRTLDATLRAVEDTGKATQAMLRQTEIAEEARRPWVHITLKQFTPITVGPDSLTCDVLLEIGNVGPTPANKVQIVDCAFSQTANKEESNLFYAEQAEAYGDGAWGDILPPNGSLVHRVPIKINLNEVPKIDIAGRAAIAPCFVICATYSAVGAKKIYQTGACYMLSMLSDGNITVFYCDPGVYNSSRAAIVSHPGASIIT